MTSDPAPGAEKPHARLPTLPPCGQISSEIITRFFRHLADAGVVILENNPSPSAWAAYMREFSKGDLWQLAQEAKQSGVLPTLSVCLVRMQAGKGAGSASASRSRPASTPTGGETETAASGSATRDAITNPSSQSSSHKPEAEQADHRWPDD